MKTSILPSRSRGAALMLALWALFLLSALVISWALDIDSRLTLSGNANRVLEAEALACSGAEVALHPLIKPDSLNLNHRLNSRESYRVQITGEGGRLNLNWLLAGEDPVRLGILRRYLEIKGIDLNERDQMIDCLLDWVEPNTGQHHLNGATDSEDYHPSHTLLALVDRFLMLRRGPDGIDGTADDTQFKSVDEIRAALGFSPEQFKQLAALVGFKDPAVRVVSVGKSGDVTRVVQMIVRKTGNVPQLVMWKEL